MTLSAAEHRILALRAAGYTRSEIQQRLGIGKTAQYEALRRAYRRLGIPPDTCPTGAGMETMHEAWRRLGWLRAPEA